MAPCSCAPCLFHLLCEIILAMKKEKDEPEPQRQICKNGVTRLPPQQEHGRHTLGAQSGAVPDLLLEIFLLEWMGRSVHIVPLVVLGGPVCPRHSRLFWGEPTIARGPPIRPGCPRPLAAPLLTLPSHTRWPHLSCGAVRHILGSFSLGNLHLLAGDAGPGERGAQEVSVLVQRAGLDGRPDELLHKLLADVLNEHLWESSPWEGALARTGHRQKTESPMACV